MNKKVIIESVVKKSAYDSLLSFLQSNLSTVRGFEGCFGVRVFLDKESGEMIFDEEWLSVDQHQKYIKFIAESGVMDKLIAHLESPPKIKYFDHLTI